MKVYLVKCTMNWLGSNETDTNNVGIFRNEETARKAIQECAKLDEDLKPSTYYNTYEIEEYTLF